MLDNIIRRKSIRSFIDEELSEETIEGLVDFLSGLTPPEPDIDWNFDTLPYLDLVRVSSTEPGVKAPHYLLLRSERKNFGLQNSGFIGEMAALYLTGLNIATCWQGGISISGSSDFPDSLPFICALAFGPSNEPFYENSAQHERVPMKKLAYGQYEQYLPLLEYMRIAPSAHNKQPCVFVVDDKARLHIYRRKPLLNNPVTAYAQCIDSGVMLAHAFSAAKELGFSPEIIRLKNEPLFKNMIYQATVILPKRGLA